MANEGMRERILVGGAPGCGKTFAWATIARAQPNHKFYVIDPDDGTRRVLYEKDEKGERVFPDLSNIEYYLTPKWYAAGSTKVGTPASISKLPDVELKAFQCGIADAWKIIKPKTKPGDWIVLEHLGSIWDRVQDGFADEVFQKDIGQYFLEKRKVLAAGSKRLDALEGWTDWQVVNKMHNDDFIVPICFENPAHVFMTSSVSMTEKNSKEDAEIKAFYGETLIRFDGQKRSPFRTQTMLLFRRAGRKDAKFIMNTFQKDRGRAWMEDEEWSDFYWEYLITNAEWETE